jgi:hypothetical protein
MGKLLITALFLAMLFSGCSSSKPGSSSQPKGEFIYRHHEDKLIQVEPLSYVERQPYPWEDREEGAYPKITKEFFRCKGSSLNPVNLVQKEKELIRYYDCGGAQKHSLPLREDKEFIYPVLIDLLNYIQRKTNKRVVITCGHCCPDHNTYLDITSANQSSKHTIGAEVDFYVQGLEQQPDLILNLIFGYYGETAKYKGLKDFEEFKRYEKKEGIPISTLPWYNKEIFVKLYKKTEGRDFDNRHPYPYLSIQVRYDWDLEKRVSYTWDQAFRNYQRW